MHSIAIRFRPGTNFIQGLLDLLSTPGERLPCQRVFFHPVHRQLQPVSRGTKIIAVFLQMFGTRFNLTVCSGQISFNLFGLKFLCT